MRASIYIIIIVGIFILSFLYLYQHSTTVQLTFTLHEKQRKLSRIEEDVERLRNSTTQLVSYSRIKSIASGWGFRYPYVNEMVIIQEKDSLVDSQQSKNR